MSDEAPNVYHIEKLTDFAKVPSERVAVCLMEFAVWIEVVRASKLHLPGTVLDILAGESFVWTDDGCQDITVNIKVIT